MKLSHIIATLLLAGAMAAMISLYLEPKTNSQIVAASTAPATPNAATLAADMPTDTNSARRTPTISVRPDGHYWTRALVN